MSRLDSAKRMQERILLQNKEFAAAERLAKALQVCNNTPVVDDDYPIAQAVYESALQRFLEALRENRGSAFLNGN